jgi:hypothetical protein
MKVLDRRISSSRIISSSEMAGEETDSQGLTRIQEWNSGAMKAMSTWRKDYKLRWILGAGAQVCKT